MSKFKTDERSHLKSGPKAWQNAVGKWIASSGSTLSKAVSGLTSSSAQGTSSRPLSRISLKPTDPEPTTAVAPTVEVNQRNHVSFRDLHDETTIGEKVENRLSAESQPNDGSLSVAIAVESTERIEQQSSVPATAQEPSSKDEISDLLSRRRRKDTSIVRSAKEKTGGGNGRAGTNEKALMLPAFRPPRVLETHLPPTPTSMLNTPKEMYRRSYSASRVDKQASRPKLKTVSELESQDWSIPLTPIENDLASLAIIANLSDISPVERTFSEPRRQLTSIKLRTGSVLTVLPPEQTAWKRTTYLHGPIKLEKPLDGTRKGSMASLEAFQAVVDELEPVQTARRASDEAVVDDILEFFDSFGLDALKDQLGATDLLESAPESPVIRGSDVRVFDAIASTTERRLSGVI